MKFLVTTATLNKKVTKIGIQIPDVSGLKHFDTKFRLTSNTTKQVKAEKTRLSNIFLQKTNKLPST